MSNLLSYRLARRSWTIKLCRSLELVFHPVGKQVDDTMTLLPNGIVREAAIVIPCMGRCPLAVIPFAFGPQHVVHEQYAVMIAEAMRLVTGIS